MTATVGEMTFEFILLKRQPFRCDWSRIERPADGERHLVYESGAASASVRLQHRWFDAVHRVPRLDRRSVAAVVDRVRPPAGARVRLATNDEFAVEVCATWGDRSHQDGGIALYRDKLGMKAAVAAQGVTTPAGVALDDLAARTDPEGTAERIVERCGLPLVVKPRRDANSKDVQRITSLDQLGQLCQVLERPDLMAEELIEGTVLLCDSFVAGPGERQVVMLAAYANPPLQYRQGACHGARSLAPSEPWAAALSGINDAVLAALPRLDRRVVHVEVIERDEELYFLEVAGRAPGAEVARAGELHVGMNLEELNFRLQLGLPHELSTPPRRHVAWMWFPKEDGKVVRRTEPDLECDATLTWQVCDGELVRGASWSDTNRREDAALIVLLADPDPARVRRDFDRLRRFSPVTYA